MASSRAKKTARKKPRRRPAGKKATAKRKPKPRKKATPRKPRPADPTRLTVAQAAKLLKVPADAIKRHLEAGAPADPAGRINLVHYAAWLNKGIADGR